LHPTFAFYRETLQNWPFICAARAARLPFKTLKLRGGHSLSLLDAREEIWAYHSIFQDHCYDKDFPEIPHDGNIVDLGANVGIFTLYAATRLAPQGKVLAVEPNPQCFHLLLRNTVTVQNVTAWNAAVGGEGKLYLSADSLGASVFNSEEAVDVINVNTVPASQVLSFFPTIDLLKVNMEGAEYPFVLNADETLWKNVNRLALKWHDESDVAQGHKPAELRDRLRYMGFSVLRHEAIWTRPGLTTGITTARRG